MSKNRRKPLKKEPVISKTDFSFYESKIYIIATIIMFHIVPLVFVMMGEKSRGAWRRRDIAYKYGL